MKRSWFLAITFIIACQSFGQGTLKKVLFIGNSYTYYNSMPETIRLIAYYNEDTLIYETHTPGGTRFRDHVTNSILKTKWDNQKWDKVVLQGQSQETSFGDEYEEELVFPYAKELANRAKSVSPCTKPMFYMTWGRKNGDAANCSYFPPVCTYQGMDSVIQSNYTKLADQNDADLVPVAKVWREIRAQYPEYELYNSDESHPSALGSYAIACTFYTCIFKRNPTSIRYSYLDSTTTSNIHKIVKKVVYDDLSVYNRGPFKLPVKINVFQDFPKVFLSVNQINVSDYYWTCNGETSTNFNPSFNVSMNGPQAYIELRMIKCGDTLILKDSVFKTGSITSYNQKIRMYPNPVADKLYFDIATARVDNAKLIDMHGREYAVEFDNEGYINLNEFPSGICIIELFIDQSYVSRQKIMLRK